MFSKKALELLWVTAVKEERKYERKTFGSNEEEARTMAYAMDKDKEFLWKEVKETSAKLFIEFKDDE